MILTHFLSISHQTCSHYLPLLYFLVLSLFICFSLIEFSYFQLLKNINLITFFFYMNFFYYFLFFSISSREQLNFFFVKKVHFKIFFILFTYSVWFLYCSFFCIDFNFVIIFFSLPFFFIENTCYNN